MVDGPVQIQSNAPCSIALMSVLTGQMSDILLSIQKMEDVRVMPPQKNARMMIDIMTTMLIASSEVIFNFILSS